MTRTVATSILALLFGSLIATPKLSEASNCGSGYVSSYYPSYSNSYSYYSAPVYEEKKIVAPIAIPIFIPTTVFQYLPAVTPALQATTVQQTAVQQTAQVATQTAQVSAMQTTQAVATNQAVQTPCNTSPAELDRLIRNRLEAMMKEQMQSRPTTGDNPPPILFSDAQPIFPDAPSQPLPQVQQPFTQPNQPAAKSTAFVSLLSQSCAGCHNTGKKLGGVQLFDELGRYAPSVSEAQIKGAIANGSMPKTGALASNLKQILLQELR